MKLVVKCHWFILFLAWLTSGKMKWFTLFLVWLFTPIFFPERLGSPFKTR